MKFVFALILSFISALLLMSCSDTDGPKGTLSVSLTDGPVVADKVVIHFTSAIVQPAAGNRFDVVVTDPDNNQVTGRSIDLLEFTGNKSTVLFDKKLPTGQYSWIRLDVNFDPLKTYIQTPDGSQHALNCTSCENNGLKLNRSFDIKTNNTMAFTLDFDLGKSITEANGSYKLRPTIRIIETIAAGNLTGTVDATLISSLGGIEGCMVYVYEGNDVIPNDIYIPDTDPVPSDHNNPISTTPVDLTTNTYTAAFLPQGEYTASLTCDAENDDPLLIDNTVVSFNHTQNATITSGTTSTVDFPVAP